MSQYPDCLMLLSHGALTLIKSRYANNRAPNIVLRLPHGHKYKDSLVVFDVPWPCCFLILVKIGIKCIIPEKRTPVVFIWSFLRQMSRDSSKVFLGLSVLPDLLYLLKWHKWEITSVNFRSFVGELARFENVIHHWMKIQMSNDSCVFYCLAQK